MIPDMSAFERQARVSAVSNETNARHSEIINALDKNEWDVQDAVKYIKKERKMRDNDAENKIIIYVHTGVTDAEAMQAVEKVVGRGKQSAKGTSYTYVSHPIKGIRVTAAKCQYGHRFHVSPYSDD